MSRRTREINRITTAIITISIKLMVLALLILLLYEAVVRGFAFGHEIFYAEAAEAAPGREITVEIKEGETAKEAAGELKKKGLITNDFAFWFQSIFYDYQDIYPGIYTLNTSMTSKEILRELNVKPEEESEASPEARTVSGEAISQKMQIPQRTGRPERFRQSWTERISIWRKRNPAAGSKRQRNKT